MVLARPAAPSSYKPASTGASTATRAATLVVKRAAQQTGRQSCWSPRLEGAECRGSKLPCGSLDGTREPSSARLRPGRARGSGTFKECQSLVEGIF